MEWIIAVAIRVLIYALLLYLLAEFFKDFEINRSALFSLAIILAVISWVLGFLLAPIKWITAVLSLGFLTFIGTWIINVIIMKVTDKFSDNLTIGSFVTLLISGAALSLADMVIRFVV